MKAKFEIVPDKQEVAVVERITNDELKLKPWQWGDFIAVLPNGEIRILPYGVFMDKCRPLEWNARVMKGEVEGLDPTCERTRISLTAAQARILELLSDNDRSYIKRYKRAYWIMSGGNYLKKVTGGTYSSLLRKGYICETNDPNRWDMTPLGKQALVRRRANSGGNEEECLESETAGFAGA